LRLPEVRMPDWKWYFEGERMKTLRWILGIVIVGAVVALVIVFWPTIMQAGKRICSRIGSHDGDELEEFPKAA
jgi:hypothetical protein